MLSTPVAAGCTGIDGMDVDHPRAWWWDLPFVFSLMGLTALLLLAWFARKGWLSGEGEKLKESQCQNQCQRAPAPTSADPMRTSAHQRGHG